MLTKRLQKAGYEVMQASDLDKAISLVGGHDIDLILLDIVLPQASGFSICAELRTRFSTPIIFMSCLDDSDSMIRAFELGGDDYLVKPFNPDVLLARVKANLRRSNNLEMSSSNKDIRRFRGFTLEYMPHTVTVDGETRQLTALEFQILSFLIANPGKYYTSEDIYKSVWGSESLGDARTVPVHIYGIRRKIEADPANPTYLIRKRGCGYSFVPDEKDAI